MMCIIRLKLANRHRDRKLILEVEGGITKNRTMADKLTRNEIMQMDDDELEDCIATLPMEDPLYKFALKQRDYVAQRWTLQFAMISMAVGVGTLFVLVSGQFAEDVDLPIWLTNWIIVIAGAIIVLAYVAILNGMKLIRHVWSRISSKFRRSDR